MTAPSIISHREAKEIAGQWALYGRPPRFRYFPAPDHGPMFFWTVETVNHRGQECYVSGVYEPVGKGSRSGKASAWSIDPDLTSRHRLRKDAKARALRLYREQADRGQS